MDLIDHGLGCSINHFVKHKQKIMETALNNQEWNQVTEIELVYKSKVKPSQRPMIKTSKEAAELLQALWNKDKIDFVEQFNILLLNRNNRVLGMVEISTGGVTGTVADPKLIFVAALKANASSIIISHNHPSGNLKPSKQDEQLTQKIKQAGLFLDMQLIDHIIVTSEGYYSFADEGLL
jgi:DNA repair protein RadC